MTRRTFLGGLAGFAAGGCSFMRGFGGAPRLSFGVVSDIHVTTPESTRVFREALRYFRGRGADAAMVARDVRFFRVSLKASPARRVRVARTDSGVFSGGEVDDRDSGLVMRSVAKG